MILKVIIKGDEVFNFYFIQMREFYELPNFIVKHVQFCHFSIKQRTKQILSQLLISDFHDETLYFQVQMKESLLDQPLSLNSSEQKNLDPIQLTPTQFLINKVNGQGKYQFRSFLIFSLTWFLTSWLLLGMGFFFDNQFTCKNSEFADEDKCRTHICSIPEKDRKDEISWHASSIVFQFQPYLICSEHQTSISLMQSMLFVGAIFGFFLIPYMADNFGRKVAIRVSWGLGTIAVLIVCLADSPNMIGLGLFLVGFGANPAITLSFSFINEICLGKSRARFGVGVQAAWAFGQTTVALIFATKLNWIYIAYIILLLFIVCFALIYFYIEETPMFMLKKHPQQALKIFNKMAEINQRQEITFQEIGRIEKNQQQQLFQQQRSLGFFDLFKYKSIRWTSISAAFIFLGIQVMYYSSQLNQNTVGFDKTINQVIFGISQLVGYLSAQLIIHKCSRKKTTMFGMGISAGLCFVLGILVQLQNEGNQDAMKWVQTVVLMINRFILCSFWSIFYVYVAQLYPTQIRSLGFGWTSVVGQIGSTISPFIKQIADAFGLNTWFPTAAIGIMSWCFVFCLSETFGLPLRDVIIERMDVLKKQKSQLEIDYTDDDDSDKPKSLPDLDDKTDDEFEDLRMKPKAHSAFYIK